MHNALRRITCFSVMLLKEKILKNRHTPHKVLTVKNNDEQHFVYKQPDVAVELISAEWC